MKISKLFHWLYATLMFLPFIFLLPTLAYYGFNEHATNSETTIINYKYQSNEVNSYDDLIEGNIYQFNCETLGLDEMGFSEFRFTLLTPLEINHEDLSYTDNDIDFNYFDSNLTLYFNDECLIRCYFDNENSYSVAYEYSGFFNNNCIIQFISCDDIDLSLLTYTDYNVIESVEVNTDETITGQVSRAWDSVWNLPLFSWTHTSFVAEPFTYITGLFGMSADNPFNYVVTYFVSISVCWLVFDFLMYVPNLAHRWLDKGALE